MSRMRSYDQYCGLAKALDVIGDRWTLLIVRELLINGPSRYTDLQRGLPGIATNMLADRLRDLQEAGVIIREEPAPPVATPLFSLTEWGEQLKPILLSLGIWAGPLMGKPAADDRILSHWLAMPLEGMLTDNSPHKKPIEIELRTGDQPITVATHDGGVRVRTGTAVNPTAIVTGSPDLIVGLLTGKIDLAAARAKKLRVEGDESALRRVRPIRTAGVTPGK